MTINNLAKRHSISDLFLSKSDIVRSKWDIVLLAACLACSQTAFGQEQKVSREADSLKSIVLNPVVVTGTGTYHRADNSPVAVKVISSKDLQDTHASNLQEALSRLTTNVTTHTNGMGTFVNVNGVSDDYVVILENGKRISGDDRWNRINMANVKRVEIFSGAASALYGSEAIAGVINIITDDSHEPLTASAYTKLMNHGRLQEEINLDVNAGKFSSHTSYGHQQADNWQVNHYQAFDEGGSEVLKLTGRPMSTAFKSDNITEKLEWKFNERWSAYLRGSYYDYRTDRPQKATYFTQKTAKKAATGEKNYTYSERQAYTYDLYHKSYTYGAGARWAPNRRAYLYLDVYSDNFSSKYDYWQTADKEAYDETRKRTHYTDETLRGIFRLAGWNKLSAGLQLIQESLHSQSDNIRFETTATYNVFAQDEIKIAGGLEAVVAFRLAHNEHFGSAFTPNVGLFYHVGGFRVRTSYAGGYRTPSLSQLYATDQAKTTARYTLYNPSLKPEKNNFYNLNLEYGNKWMTASVSGFVNKIRDMINYRTLTQAEIDGDSHLSSLYSEGWTTIRKRDNIDRASLCGVNVSLKLLLPCGFTLSGSYAYTDSKAKTRSLDKKTQQYLFTESPVDKSVRNVYNVFASWDHDWSNYHLNVTLNGHIQSRRYSSTYGYADGYSQWDLTTRHTVSMAHFVVEPGLGVENVFNQRDTSPWNANFSTISPGRSFIVSVRLKY